MNRNNNKNLPNSEWPFCSSKSLTPLQYTLTLNLSDLFHAASSARPLVSTSIFSLLELFHSLFLNSVTLTHQISSSFCLFQKHFVNPKGKYNDLTYATEMSLINFLDVDGYSQEGYPVAVCLTEICSIDNPPLFG